MAKNIGNYPKVPQKVKKNLWQAESSFVDGLAPTSNTSGENGGDVDVDVNIGDVNIDIDYEALGEAVKANDVHRFVIWVQKGEKGFEEDGVSGWLCLPNCTRFEIFQNEDAALDSELNVDGNIWCVTDEGQLSICEGVFDVSDCIYLSSEALDQFSISIDGADPVPFDASMFFSEAPKCEAEQRIVPACDEYELADNEAFEKVPSTSGSGGGGDTNVITVMNDAPEDDECATKCDILTVERYADGADVTLNHTDLLDIFNSATGLNATCIYTIDVTANAPNSDSADGTFTSGPVPDFELSHLGEPVDYDSGGTASVCRNNPLKEICARAESDYLADDLSLYIRDGTIIDICIQACEK